MKRHTWEIRANVKKIEAILQALLPMNVKEVESFLGGINYYSRYIPNMLTIANPLYWLSKKVFAWNWTELQQESFTKLKNKLDISE